MSSSTNTPSPLFLPFPFFLFLFEIVFFASFARSRAGRSLTTKSADRRANDLLADLPRFLNHATRPHVRTEILKEEGERRKKRKRRKKEIYCI